MAKLRFEFNVEGLEPETFVVRKYQGYESLSAAEFDQQSCNGFRYSISLASRDHSLTPDQLVDCQATLALYLNGQCERRIRGIICQFTQGDIGHNHTYYEVELVLKSSVYHYGKTAVYSSIRRSRKSFPCFCRKWISRMSISG